MTRSNYHAEEIVQEVFIRVWIHRKKISAIRDMRSWLFVITKRIVFDYVVRLSKEKKILATCKRNVHTDQTDALLPARCRQLFAEAQQKLTPRLLEVYQMKTINNLSGKQIAKILKLSEYTVKGHIKKSVALVKKHVLMSLEIAA